MVTDHSILLFEAETTDAEVLKRLIKERLPEVNLVVVESALTYTDFPSSHRFIAIIAAQELYRAEGIDVLASLRGQYPRVPLILLSNNLTSSLVHRAVQARIDFQLQKDSSGLLTLVGLIEEAIFRPGALASSGGMNWAEYSQDAPITVCTLTSDGDILAVNNSFKTLFGDREWDGQSVFELLPKGQHASTLTDTLTGGGPPVRLRFRTREEERDMLVVTFLDKYTEEINLLIFDDPARHDDEAGEEETALHAREGLRQLVHAVSHDLQEPLQLANRYAKLLADDYQDRLDEDGRRCLTNLQRSTAKGQEMLDDLLEMSRIEQRNSNFERVELNELVDEIFSLFQLTIDEIGAKVSREDLPAVFADRRQLARVFQNLIGNAIKFRSQKPLRILVTARDYGPAWCLVVRDNGVGIERDQQQRVFEMFRRLRGNEDVPGSGMGLAICRRIVERHGGRIWLRSLPGKGSAFYFTLPRQAG